MKSILQTPEWAEFKRTQGFKILKLGSLFVHQRPLPLGRNFLYLPEVAAKEISAAQIEELKEMTRREKAIFSRLEILDRFEPRSHKLILSLGFIKAFEEVQPKWRQIISLEKTRGALLSEMKSKGRYNIKVAQKHQVEVSAVCLKGFSDKATAKATDTLYALYSETASREKISLRSLDYFKGLVDSFSDKDYLRIYIAAYRGAPLAAALVSFCGDAASYLYGGSSRRHKEVMAPYLLHWKIICDAKEAPLKRYDLVGRSAPADFKADKARFDQKWAGITRFKEQFGGEAVEMLGGYDFVNQSFWYKAFRLAEKFRR